MNLPPFAVVLESQSLIAAVAADLVSFGTQCVKTRGKFVLGLSGGSTPKALYAFLAEHCADSLDWKKVTVVFSDERAVAPTDSQSNYKMAMDAGFAKLGCTMHRMEAEGDIAAGALAYEKHVKKIDLLLLGMGEDGHTASLFPDTEALAETKRLSVANFVPQLKTWRMTLTYKAIAEATQVYVLVTGKSKAEILRASMGGNYPISPLWKLSHVRLYADEAAACSP